MDTGHAELAVQSYIHNSFEDYCEHGDIHCPYMAGEATSFLWEFVEWVNKEGSEEQKNITRILLQVKPE